MSNTSGLRESGVIVTGAGSGIGRAAALRFAHLGAKVLIADINPAGAESVAKEIEADGGTARVVIGDLSDQGTVEEVVTTAVQSFGHLDVLVNNAGIRDSGAATADVSDTEWGGSSTSTSPPPSCSHAPPCPICWPAAKAPSSTPPPRPVSAAARPAPPIPSPSTAWSD